MRTVPAFIALAMCAWSAEQPPSWVLQAAATPVAAISPDAGFMVLLRQEDVRVDSDGRRTMKERGVIRVLSSRRASPVITRTYNVKTGKIREFNAWILPAEGEPSTVQKSAVADVALDNEAAYDESRAKILDLGRSLTPRSLLAYEITEEEKTIFTQYQYSFRDAAPVALSRFTLTLPPGWEAKGVPFNAGSLSPVVSGSTWTWEMRDIPWTRPEAHSPRERSRTPWLGVTFFPASGNLRPLATWPAVADWLSTFMDPAAEVTPDITGIATHLTGGSADFRAKVESIARYAQAVNYVSVQMNVTKGGGYTPHRAKDVAARKYGDCKDKATLMRALLRSAGIDSYIVGIYSGDRNAVQSDWPSPLQFNHAIVAIKVASDIRLPGLLEDPDLGRLWFFDPTAPHVRLGDLPGDEQGSYALVVAQKTGKLVKVPLTSVKSSGLETITEAKFLPAGGLSATVQYDYKGEAAARMRGAVQSSQPDALRKQLEPGMSRRLGGLKVTSLTQEAVEDGSRFRVRVGIEVSQFGQLMGGSLYTFSPGLLSPSKDYGFSESERKTPVSLEADVRKHSVAIAVPESLSVDEIPPPVQLDSPVGSYRASWKHEPGILRFEESTEIRDAVVAP